MEAGEVEFLAEKELVTITPNFSENKITLISVSRSFQSTSYKSATCMIAGSIYCIAVSVVPMSHACRYLVND